MYKKAITVSLIVFVVISIIYMVISNSSINNSEKGKTEQKQALTKNTIIVYYFHTTFRCHSCTQIEKLTKTSIERQFSDRLSNGTLVFKSINVQEDNNKHFIKDYKLFTKSVVIADNRKGNAHKWKRLDRTWELLQDEKNFEKYIYNELSDFIASEG